MTVRHRPDHCARPVISELRRADAILALHIAAIDALGHDLDVLTEASGTKEQTAAMQRVAAAMTEIDKSWREFLRVIDPPAYLRLQ